jgi:hypothetical protein
LIATGTDVSAQQIRYMTEIFIKDNSNITVSTGVTGMEGITQRRSFEQIIQKDFKFNNEEYYQHMTTTDECNNYPLAGDIEIHALSIISGIDIKVFTHQGRDEYTEYQDFNNQMLQDAKLHTITIAFNPMARHYDGIKIPKISQHKEQKTITIKEPKQKILTEEIRRDEFERKRKRNEDKIQNIEEQQPIERSGNNSYKSNEPNPKNKQKKQEECEESNYPTVRNKNKGTPLRKQDRKRAYNKKKQQKCYKAK